MCVHMGVRVYVSLYISVYIRVYISLPHILVQEKRRHTGGSEGRGQGGEGRGERG
jgi:hypothetical protein